MRILWVTNFAMLDVCSALNRSLPMSGSWLETAKTELLKDDSTQLYIICIERTNKNDYKEFNIGGVKYYLLKANMTVSDMPSKWLCSSIKSVLNDVKPDIIHIHGTEFSNALAFISELNNYPICISIQGLISTISNKENYFAGISTANSGFFSSVPLIIQRKTALKRAKQEIEILKQFPVFFGRTDWDRAHLYAINPDAKYIRVAETVREEIKSHEKWCVHNSKNHTIFYGGGARVPWKGFHKFIETIKILKKEYTDLMVYVAGVIPQKRLPIIGNIGYGRYMTRLIEKNGLSSCISFTGSLNANEMADLFCSSRCYVMGSSIENSSNTLLEAMTIGTPIVAADVGGTSTFVSHGKDAFLYRYEETQLAAWYIKQIFESDKLAKTFSRNAQTNCSKMDSERTDLLSAYKTVISYINSNRGRV